ncbi:techylectin-5A [Caerostris darwini]|uniref:Techylectin-5A n=1 Tax=Caerostris darwini TaxID=1538125 RepID=A0AAV4RNG1_9ARAC|nr:techylectin-5A [Caerostris darwini]
MTWSSSFPKILRDHAICCAVICVMSALILLTGYYATRASHSSCGEKEKAIALMKMAEEMMNKAKELYLTDGNIPEFNDDKYIPEASESIEEFLDTTSDLESTDTSYRPRDCSEIYKSGRQRSGVYTIWPRNETEKFKPLKVYCDMDIDGGWTLIQRRGNFPKQQDFNLDWKSYKEGFGDIRRDFWLGNDNIYILSNQGPCEIRFDLEDSKGNRRFAIYKNFRIDDVKSDYTLHIRNYSGNAGDGMKYHDGQKFAAKILKGAWWVYRWAYCHLNGRYLPGSDDPESIHWYEWLLNEGLAATEIKIRLK